MREAGIRPSVASGVLCFLLAFLLACTPSATTAPTSKPSPAPATTPAPRTTASPVPKAPSVPTAPPVAFAGKTITVVVPYSAGGGNDIVGRVYGRFLSRFLPGNPSVIVRNMPGGESIVGTNYAYEAKPDGLTALMAGSSVAMADLLRKAAMKPSSLTEMTAVIGSPPVGEIYYVKTGLVDKPEDFVKAKGIVYGGTAGGGPLIIFIIAKEILAIPTDKVITAYTGSADARRAFLSGEVNASGDTNTVYETDLRALHEKRELQFLFQSGRLDETGNIVRHPAFPGDILTVGELYERIHGKAPSGMAYDAYKAMVGSVDSLTKLLLLPPGTPDNIKKLYWSAAQTMAKDPEFLKIGRPVAGPGDWMAGETLDKLFKKEFGLKPEVRDWLKNLLKAKYDMVL